VTVESDSLSKLLKAIRAEHRWTQEDLARRLGVTRPQVCQYESGRSDMPASKLLALLEEVGWPYGVP
jgi:transcriptional regulator with XRE-family HTH domain